MILRDRKKLYKLAGKYGLSFAATMNLVTIYKPANLPKQTRDD